MRFTMSDVQRICPQCGGASPLQAQHCPHCGYDFQAGLPIERANALPATLSKAAVPVLLGAASLALRVGWKMLQGHMFQATTQAVAQRPPEQAIQPRRPRRTIRIRSTWAVGDARGRWEQGSSEHIIEFDD
jgi:rubredoxin